LHGFSKETAEGFLICGQKSSGLPALKKRAYTGRKKGRKTEGTVKRLIVPGKKGQQKLKITRGTKERTKGQKDKNVVGTLETKILLDRM